MRNNISLDTGSITVAAGKPATDRISPMSGRDVQATHVFLSKPEEPLLP